MKESKKLESKRKAVPEMSTQEQERLKLEKEQENQKRRNNAFAKVWEADPSKKDDSEMAAKTRWRNDRYLAVNVLKQTGNLDVYRTKSPKLTQQTLKKEIMIICPVCERTYVLKGLERSRYLRRIKRRKYRYGRPCSESCKNDMMKPEIRRNLIDVSNLYKEL